MFVHHVFFWMPTGATGADKAALKTGIKSLNAIPNIHFSHLGTPADTNRTVIDSSYTFSWLTVFETAEDEAAYQVHPVHLKFVDDCKHLWERVLVYDSL
ncbi:MAG: Dabb family protein [Lewinellaceae bacterium]|nr:Dabb family protein [Lewinellaceae bacterium]